MEELAQLEQLVRNQTSDNQFLISSIREDEMNQISNGAILLNILNIVQKLEAGEKFTKSLNFDAPGTLLFNTISIETQEEVKKYSICITLVVILNSIIDKLNSMAKKRIKQKSNCMKKLLLLLFILIATFLVHSINIGLGLIAITFNIYFISAMCVGQAIGLLVSLLISYAVKRRKRRNNNPKKYELNRGSHQVASCEKLPAVSAGRVMEWSSRRENRSGVVNNSYWEAPAADGTFYSGIRPDPSKRTKHRFPSFRPSDADRIASCTVDENHYDEVYIN